jgi:hypothetical protein
MTNTARLRELAGKLREFAPTWGFMSDERGIASDLMDAASTAILSLLDELDASKARIAELEGAGDGKK